MLSVDCNNFFLKYILWVPPEHWILKVRLAIWAFSAIGATKEFYEYISNEYCYKFGPFLWLTVMTILVEFSIIVKFGSRLFVNSFPVYVKVIWSIIGAFLIAGAIYAYSNQIKNERKRAEEHKSAVVKMN